MKLRVFAKSSLKIIGILCFAFIFPSVAYSATNFFDDFENIGSSTQQQVNGLGDLYGDIGGQADTFSPFGPSRNQVAFDAFWCRISEVPKNLQNEIPAETNAILVVNATIAPDWHLYSITQPLGGPIRGEFTVDASRECKLLGSFYTASDLHVEYSELYDGLRIESHTNTAIWIAPLKIESASDAITVSGKLNGQICEGEGGVCIQIRDLPFTAKFKGDFDVLSLMQKAEQMRDYLVSLNSDSQKTPAAEDNSGVNGAKNGNSNDEIEYRPQETVKVTSFAMALLYAFLGGLILNVMPCVLPVIGLKILSFFEQAGKSRVRAFVLNIWYTLGIVSVFVVLALLSAGLSLMFTYDLFNIIMVFIVFAMSLSLMDVWELHVPTFLGSGKSVELMEKEGGVGAFFKGIITTLLAIPCGAPLLAPALLWADEQIRIGASINVLIAYVFIGLGLASPFLVIGAFPELLRFMPKPGMWMVTFKKTMGFFLLVAVVWILYYISLDCIVPTVAVMFALWFACWIIGRHELTATAKQRTVSWIAALVVLLGTTFISFDLPYVSNKYTLQNAMKTRLEGYVFNSVQTMIQETGNGAFELVNANDNQSENKEFWQPFTVSKLNGALKEGRPVIIDFTADWCMSCKWFEASVLTRPDVEDVIASKNVLSLKADCTKNEMEGAVFLQKLVGGPPQQNSGSGISSAPVPVLAFFTPEKPTEPILIRGGFSKKTVLDLLNSVSDK
ncbi:MAG: protein-disulfide reductase DsbD family protein [Thermoguttaceae bacterium]